MVQISTSSSLFQLFLPIYSFKFVHLYIMLFYSVLYLLYQLTLFLFSGFRCAFNIYYPAIVSVSQRCHSRVCSRASCAHCGSVVLMPHSLRRVLFSFFFFFLFSGIFRGVFFSFRFAVHLSVSFWRFLWVAHHVGSVQSFQCLRARILCATWSCIAHSLLWFHVPALLRVLFHFVRFFSFSPPCSFFVARFYICNSCFQLWAFCSSSPERQTGIFFGRYGAWPHNLYLLRALTLIVKAWCFGTHVF